MERPAAIPKNLVNATAPTAGRAPAVAEVQALFDRPPVRLGSDGKAQARAENRRSRDPTVIMMMSGTNRTEALANFGNFAIRAFQRALMRNNDPRIQIYSTTCGIRSMPWSRSSCDRTGKEFGESSAARHGQWKSGS
jgi:hypothetical protein